MSVHDIYRGQEPMSSYITFYLDFQTVTEWKFAVLTRLGVSLRDPPVSVLPILGIPMLGSYTGAAARTLTLHMHSKYFIY